MSIVLDASIALAWIYSDEKNQAAISVYDVVRRSGAWAPPIWPLEVANSLQQGVLRKRISAEFRDQSLADLAELNIQVDAECSSFAWAATLRLADRFRLTLYDACYLELAQRRGLPLASLDRELRNAARKLSLGLLGN